MPIHRPFFAAVALVAACSSQPAPPTSTAPPTPTPLLSNLHPFTLSASDLGPLTPSTPLPSISFILKPTPAQLTARTALLASIQDPTSPTYHHWLTPESYAALFGARPSSLARITTWLTSQGFTVTGPSRTGTQLFFSGTAADVARAFDTELHRYVHPAEPDVTHVALSRAPSVPADIGAMVHGLHGLHDFRKHARPLSRRARPHPLYDAGPDNQDAISFSPADYATVYDLNPLYTAGIDGTGQSIVIVGQSDVLDADIAGFRSLFSLPSTAPIFKRVLVPNTGALGIQPNDVDESELDLEWSGAVAKNAQILFVTTGNAALSNGVDDALAYAINEDLAPVISESYGGCEVGEPADANLVGELGSAANLLGITIVAASGDTGAAGCLPYVGGLNIGPPADFPGVTAVGGTEFPAQAQIPPYFSAADVALEYPAPGGVTLETTWNDSTAPAVGSQGFGGASAGGGGPSAIFPKPYWQVGVTPSDGFRDIPDVSLSASPNNLPYVIYDTNNGGSSQDGGIDPVVAIGGTSCAAPAFAGILALLNQELLKKNGAAPGLGNANPVLYALAKSAPLAFHDITTGDNVVPCTPSSDPSCPGSGTYGGYKAAAGYDLATGLGSVDADKLVGAWAGLNPTTTTLALGGATAALGAPIQLTATVGSSATTPAMTGTVSFTFVTYANDGGADESWLLGSTPVTAAATGGTATLTTAIPPGTDGQVDVVAEYSGDPSYLWSQSARTRIAVTGLTLAIAPASATLRPNQYLTMTATGGAQPLLWEITRDSTYDQSPQNFGNNGANIFQTAGAPTCVYQAGVSDGETVVHVKAADGQDAFLTVTVAGTPADAGAFPDAGTFGEAGAPAGGVDSGPGGEDGIVAGGPKSGCSCGVVGSGSGSGSGWAGVMVGVAVAVRRRVRRLR